MRTSPPTGRDQIWLLAAVAVPLAVTAALVPFRDTIANTNAALLLVLLVVAAAAGSGRRLPGIVAAISAGSWFDFFLTRPYQRLAIDDRADVETAVLLLVVGIAVSELAVWGRRQHAAASRQAGFVAGIQEAVAATGSGSSPAAVIEAACEQLSRLLGLRRCRFDDSPGGARAGHPRLGPDGQVEIDGAVCDVERYGLPTTRNIELPVLGEGGYRGRFVLTADDLAHPSLAQRLTAVALADQVAARLAVLAHGEEQPPGVPETARRQTPGSHGSTPRATAATRD